MRLPGGKLHVLHELHEPGELKPDTLPFDNTARPKVDTVERSVGFLIDMDREPSQGLTHRHAIADRVNLDPP